MNKLPIYDAIFEADSEILNISLVDEPAVELDYLKFNKDGLWSFSKDDKMILTGCAMLADTPLYRYSKSKGEYYVRFGKETLKNLVGRYLNSQRDNFNLQHSEVKISDAILLESYFIDKERGLCPKEFLNVTDGSWFVTIQITDRDVWNRLKADKKLNGFSIEVIADLEVCKDETVDSFLKNVIGC